MPTHRCYTLFPWLACRPHMMLQTPVRQHKGFAISSQSGMPRKASCAVCIVNTLTCRGIIAERIRYVAYWTAQAVALRPQAGVHPEQPGNTLSRDEFDRVWEHSVLLLQRGFKEGSILTVDPDEARKLGRPWTRRRGLRCSVL